MSHNQTGRVSAIDVRAMYDRTVRAARSAGLDTGGWYLMRQHDSDGITWRLCTRLRAAGQRTPDGEPMGALSGLGNGTLGPTRQARDTLHVLAVAWETIAATKRAMPIKSSKGKGKGGEYA